MPHLPSPPAHLARYRTTGRCYKIVLPYAFEARQSLEMLKEIITMANSGDGILAVRINNQRVGSVIGQIIPEPVRVHPGMLSSQGLSEELCGEKNIWEDRYRSIVDLESHLYRNGTRTIKIFLHLSQEEQRKRFLSRIDDADKNWKFSLADIQERKYWKKYMDAYETCLNATSTHQAPWYVVPADDKENARLIVSRIVLDSLEGVKMAYPKTSPKRRLELKAIRKQLRSPA
jgi:Polyphosphate kinase 2 (PPK2)